MVDELFERGSRVMGLFGKLIKTVVDVALIPTDVVKDFVNAGDLFNEIPSQTAKRCRKIVKDLEEAGDDAGNGDFL